jgi:hypothetical protein
MDFEAKLSEKNDYRNNGRIFLMLLPFLGIFIFTFQKSHFGFYFRASSPMQQEHVWDVEQSKF